MKERLTSVHEDRYDRSIQCPTCPFEHDVEPPGQQSVGQRSLSEVYMCEPVIDGFANHKSTYDKSLRQTLEGEK